MAVHLDHTIVPARDKSAAARFFAQMFGLTLGETVGPFAPVQIDAALTLEFADADDFEAHHYGFLLSDAEFDAILSRVRTADVPFGAGPGHGWNRQIDCADGGRRVYFQDPNGHSYEIFTRA